MGVFDFVKDAGAKVGIGESTTEAEAKAAAEQEAKDSAREARAKEVQERLAKNKAEAAKKADMKERMAEAKKARGLEDFVRGLGFKVDNLDVRFDDGVAEVEGMVADQETREKIILAIGNTDGVGQVKDAIDVAEPGEMSDMHAVVRGDTLWGLAEKYYGDGHKYPEIFEANKPMLKDPNKIYVGQVLRIPNL
ncbi:MAG: peptidoglycan-binding protein LysM [Acidimicrobiales bacterium]|nr:peptidoglycan-binding protein LysM [Acidimicrobiales bacterium]